jgi:hypothetical protein
MRTFSGPRDPFERRNHGRGPRSVQHRAQRESARHGVGIGLVVEQNQDAVRVGEVALILLHAGSGQRAAELGEQRRFEQLRQRQIGHVGKMVANCLGPLLAIGGADAKDVNERASGVAYGVDHFWQKFPAAVLDDDAGLG